MHKDSFIFTKIYKSVIDTVSLNSLQLTSYRLW